MKLSKFVKSEPERACRAILILSIAFLMCFGALIALGTAYAYTENHRRERAALLAAAEILSVNKSADESSAQVSSALVSSRAGDFLSEADARLLTELLGLRDARFSAFCAEVETMLSRDTFSVSGFIRALRLAFDNVGILSHTARVHSPAEMAELVGVRRDYASLAAKFVGIRNIFSADAPCAYCDNAVVVFSSESGRPVAYAVAALPKEIRLTEEECALAVLEYATGKFDLRSPILIEIQSKNGICHAVIGGEGFSAVAGVRMDTGGVVYFRIVNT